MMHRLPVCNDAVSLDAPNARGHRPGREQRERPVRCTAKFDASNLRSRCARVAKPCHEHVLDSSDLRCRERTNHEDEDRLRERDCRKAGLSPHKEIDRDHGAGQPLQSHECCAPIGAGDTHEPISYEAGPEQMPRTTAISTRRRKLSMVMAPAFGRRDSARRPGPGCGRACRSSSC